MKLSFYRLFVLSCAGLSVTACGTNWYNPHLTSEQASRQFEIDKGYCNGAVQGSVPIPDVRPYPSQPSAYVVQSYGDIYGRGGSAHYTSNSLVTPLSSDSFGAGFANGVAMGNVLAASSARKQMYRSCLMRLGWYDDKAEAMRVAQSLQQTGDKVKNGPQFWSELERQVPDYRKINSDSRFHDWLSVTDSTTGKQRQQLLVEAQQRNDADTVAAMFKQFLKTL